jgi:hypothetical protein
MQLTRRLFLTTLIVSFVSLSFGQNPDKTLTANQIIQKAIDSSGGDKIFDLIKNVETISQIITSKGDTLSFSVKRMNFDKYYISSLSLGYANTTTVYNKGKAALISNQNAQQILDPLKLEELQLQSYISIEYGYKKLGYTLERESDQKFQNFDCFVVLVSSPLGRTTINYYDKKTGNLIMIIYPNLNKSVFIDFYKAKGITCPSKILMVDTLGAITSSTLIKLNYDETLDSNWFNVPAAGVYAAPKAFKTGTFKYVNSNDDAKVVREETKQTEIAGVSKKEYKIEWSTDSDYLIYRLINAANPPTNDNVEYIKVRITSWIKNRYYCQYITSSNIGGTCAFEKVD